MADQDEETFNILKEKHPEPSWDLNFPNSPDATTNTLITTEEDVHKAIFSLYNEFVLSI